MTSQRGVALLGIPIFSGQRGGEWVWTVWLSALGDTGTRVQRPIPMSVSQSPRPWGFSETPEGLLPLCSEQGSAKALNTDVTGQERGRTFCPVQSRNYVQVWGVLSKGTG